MERIGNYEYPDRGSFKDALLIAEDALTKYGGVIPNEKAAEKLGYSVKSRASISGFIYKRFDDICLFGLTRRERGVMKTTDLAVKALDPINTEKAAEGKAEAVRRVKIVAEAFEAWNGKVPSETALPAKIEQITGVSWIEAKKHTESLKNLFIEVFPYLRTAPEPTAGKPAKDELGGDIMEPERETGRMTISARGKGFGFTKTLPFTNKGIDSLRKLVEFLETQIETEETEEQTEVEEQKD